MDSLILYLETRFNQNNVTLSLIEIILSKLL